MADFNAAIFSAPALIAGEKEGFNAAIFSAPALIAGEKEGFNAATFPTPALIAGEKEGFNAAIFSAPALIGANQEGAGSLIQGFIPLIQTGSIGVTGQLVNSLTVSTPATSRYALRANRTSDSTWQYWMDTTVQIANAPGGSGNYDAASLVVSARIRN